ncbi:MAG: FdtA/QdtA family cupin domain-containing protein [Candidatus Niyogibacteria bacterium]|nr:FdtA/QdtA family cupin domain-containing protein [Candidatus Niyogibacteria bacterium]
MAKIKVKNANFIKLPIFSNYPHGDLGVGEIKKNIPFAIKKFYFINHMFDPKTIRGRHAHKKLQQALFCINGSFELHLDDGYKKQRILMNDPSSGVFLGAKLWRVMKKFSRDCVILVLAGDYYKKNDYIRDYESFLRYVKNKTK